MWKLISGVLWIWSFIQVSQTLRDVKINVPQAVIRGKNAILDCSFNLEGEKLYSVKWYRGSHEFYRYTPIDIEPRKFFPGGKLNVNQNESNDTKIILENVSRDISGQFSCEVTVEKPSFFTVIQTADLKVVDIPKQGPSITGLRQLYTPSEILHANCTSEDSFPAANITWHINGLWIREPHVTQHTVNKGLFSTFISTIRYRLSKKSFIKRKLKVRCSANIYDVYHKSIEITVWKIRNDNNVLPKSSTTVTPTYDNNIDEENNSNVDDLYSSSEINDNSFLTLLFYPSKSTRNCNIGKNIIILIQILCYKFS